jgi:serine/threonine protein phosphatase 1
MIQGGGPPFHQAEPLSVRHAASTTGRVIAIGDVHGCAHALETLLEAIGPTSADELVFLGDLIDQGRDTRDVLERAIALQSTCRVVVVRGNHEEMMLAARDDEQALGFWERCGGFATINSYRYGGKLADIPDEHWRLVESTVPYYETDDFIFTHANYLPDVPMSEQPGHQLRWALFDPSDMRPHCSGKPVTVGHTEQNSGEILDLGFAACIDTACWRYGWLTALEPASGEMWQASRWGMLRAPGEATHRERLTRVFRAE